MYANSILVSRVVIIKSLYLKLYLNNLESKSKAKLYVACIFLKMGKKGPKAWGVHISFVPTTILTACRFLFLFQYLIFVIDERYEMDSEDVVCILKIDVSNGLTEPIHVHLNIKCAFECGFTPIYVRE